MKKNLVKAIFVVAIVMVSGINMFSSQKSETLSEVALANVEALAADKPGGDFNCWWDSEEYVSCDLDGDWLGCPCGSHEW